MVLLQVKPRNIYHHRHNWTFAKKVDRIYAENNVGGHFREKESLTGFLLEFIL
jgi:hypothetical protein